MNKNSHQDKNIDNLIISDKNVDNLSILEETKNEKNIICQKFINALEECFEINKNCYPTTINVDLPEFNLLGKIFDLKNCLDINNQIIIKNKKINVDFMTEREFIPGKSRGYFTYNSNEIHKYEGRRRKISFYKNIKFGDTNYDSKFIVSDMSVRTKMF